MVFSVSVLGLSVKVLVQQGVGDIVVYGQEGVVGKTWEYMCFLGLSSP